MIKPLLRAVFFVLMLSFGYQFGYAQKERAEIADNNKWNFADMYQSDEAWQVAKNQLIKESEKVLAFKGNIGQSAKNLLDYLRFSDDFYKEGSRLYLYASLKSDVDIRNQENLSRLKDIQQVFIDYGQKSSFATPEIAALSKETIDKFMQEEPGLVVYKMPLENLLRMKEHTLSPEEEAIMAKTGLIIGTPSAVYGIYSDAEMTFPTATLSDGTEVVVNKTVYGKYRASANRADREIVFKAFWDHFKTYEGTFGEMLNGQVKVDIFQAQARHYKSALEAALKPDNIPVDVYYSLVENVNKNLPTFYRYLKLKKRMLGVDQLKYSDLYAPTVKGVELKYTYEEARELIPDALKPLGKEYVEVIEKAFDNRWIDVYPNAGKASGAYSNGAAYDVHPYILMNYNGQYNEVSTLAHELGHTMQSYYSNKTQPYATADYATFVAEVASTFNEALLSEKMKKELKDDDLRLSLLMSMLDGFKGTLFRQTQFAEFELKIHEAAEAGTPLTGQVLSDIYGDITRKYYGHDKKICLVDDNISMEWAYIPHFYMNFYVFQYSTSFVASQALVDQVLNKEKGAKERYLEFLSAGGSDYPIALLKNAGVDMLSPEPFDRVIAKMNGIMDEIEKILDKKK
ncbi:oligoendopeptidase F [Marinilabiliaceae bacterium JC017]|nr:oligoendopeptidase F [Marinilabiliaceae bacterium JC017]